MVKRYLVRGIAGGVFLLGSVALPAHAQDQYQSSDDDQSTTCSQSANDTQDNTNSNNRSYTNNGVAQVNVDGSTLASYNQTALPDTNNCNPANSGDNVQVNVPAP